MKQRFIGISVAFMVLAIVLTTHSSPRDYASLRKAADAFAAQKHPGSKLWRVDLTGSYSGGSLQIQEGEFHYFCLKCDLGSAGALSHMLRNQTILSMLKVKSLEGMHLPQIDVGQYPSTFQIEEWQMAPVPGDVHSPEELLRGLNRPLRGDPYRNLIRLNLIQAGAALADSSRNRFQWGLLANAMGTAPPASMDFFARTVPLGKWIWWTHVEQDRPYPGSNPKAVGTPRRVEEYIYIDAVTGKITSHCKGPTPSPIPCQEETAGKIQPREESLRSVTGRVKSTSGGRLVIVTDRDMSVSLRKGTEMTFELNQPHLRSLNLQSGDYVTIRYEKQSDRMIAHEITLRSLGTGTR